MSIVIAVLAIVLVLASAVLAFDVYLNALRERLREPVLAPEIHNVVTEDGWTIRLHRLASPNGPGEPVLLCHGLATNHFNFMLPPRAAIGDALAEAGYDCWLIDLRACGSAIPAPGVSRLDATMDDLLLRDIPAAVEHIAKVTGYDKVHWVGHSMGGMLLYAYELRFGNARLASAVTLGAPIGFAGVRHKSHSFLVAVATYAHRLMSNAFRALTPLISSRKFKVRLLPIDWNNTDTRIGAAEVYHAMELPLPHIGGQMNAWASTQTWVMCGGALDVPSRLNELQTPLLAVFGRSDPFIPQNRARAFFDALPNPDKKMVVLSKENGYSADYNHIDLAVSTNGPEEVQRPIVEWLKAHPIRAQRPEPVVANVEPKAAPRKRAAAPKKSVAPTNGKVAAKKAVKANVAAAKAKSKPAPKPKQAAKEAAKPKSTAKAKARGK